LYSYGASTRSHKNSDYFAGMINPDYPKHPYRIKKDGEMHIIFDEFRKLWVKLTPEEWVRQNFVQWLVQVKNIPQR
jgi:hypothetical protein